MGGQEASVAMTIFAAAGGSVGFGASVGGTAVGGATVGAGASVTAGAAGVGYGFAQADAMPNSMTTTVRSATSLNSFI
jgi:hypothetical protein